MPLLGLCERALQVYGEIVMRFSGATEPALAGGLTGALLSKGHLLEKLGRREEAISAYDDLLTRSIEAEKAIVREQVAWALDHKASNLIELDR